MNQNVQPHSGAWVTFTYGSFAASALLVALGVFFMPIDLWMKGYLTMGIVMLVQPFSLDLFSYSFVTILAGTLGYVVVSHFPE